MPSQSDPTAQTLLAHLNDRAGAHAAADLHVDERGLGDALDTALASQFAPRPAVDGSAADVLAIASLDPLVTEWVTGGGGGVTLEQVQDDLGNTSLVAGTSLTKVYDDGAGTITLNVDAADFAAASTAPTISSGAGAPASTPSKVGDIYIDTTGDNAYIAVGTASSADWEISNDGGGGGSVDTSGTPVANDFARFTDANTIEGRSYSEVLSDLGISAGANNVDVAVFSGTWPSRPTADIVVWVADGDTAATTPGAATGDDIVILAQDADLTAIAALTSAADKLPYATGAGTWAMADLPSFGRTLIANTTALAAVQDLRTAPATVTGTTDTLAAADDDTVILYTAAGAVTVTLANIAVGFECVLVCLGAGGLTVAAGGMSFANSFTPNLTVAQGESLYVKQTAASTFIVLGGTAT
jgi:hypothetical protein